MPSAAPSSTSFSEKPTVAISGAVKMFEVILRSSSGMTMSPSAWNTAVRPCIAATEAKGKKFVQSPTA